MRKIIRKMPTNQLKRGDIITHRDTLAIKGFAVLLLLLHHLFSAQSQYSLIFFSGKDILLYFSISAKVCVAIFVIISGYGLTKSWQSNRYPWVLFYYKRLKKIYFTFWVVFGIFVPLGVLFFGRTLTAAYGVKQTDLKLIVDFFGLGSLFYGRTFNITWWYMSLIIILYLFYPAILSLIRRYKFKGVFFLFAASLVFKKITALFLTSDIYLTPLVFLFSTFEYVVCFAMGIYSALFLPAEYIKKFLMPNKMSLIYLLALILLAVYMRFKSIIGGTSLDFVFGSLLVLLCCNISKRSSLIERFFIFFGIYSYEIFLSHTFIYFYYYRKEFYHFRSPLAAYSALVCASLVAAIFIKFLSNLILKSFENNIESKFYPKLRGFQV